LLSGISRITTRLDENGLFERGDAAVARALWQDAKTVRQIAQSLGISEDAVQQARLNILKFIAVNIANRADSPPSRPSGYDIHIKERAMSVPADLLKQALASPGDLELLAAVRERAGEIIAYLESAEGASDQESFITFEERSGLTEGDSHSHRERLARVFEALAAGHGLSTQEQCAIEDLVRADKDEESWVAWVFANTLMDQLPNDVMQLDTYFANQGLRRIPRPDRLLLDQKILEEGRPYAEQLAAFDLSPLTVYFATEAVLSVYDRGTRHGVIEPSGHVLLDLADASDGPDEGRDAQVFSLWCAVESEIRMLAGCSKEAARAVLRWTAEVASTSRPYLFRGFRVSDSEPGRLVLQVLDDEGEMTLDQRWGLVDRTGFVAPITPGPARAHRPTRSS
jgi:hypothetical protein